MVLNDVKEYLKIYIESPYWYLGTGLDSQTEYIALYPAQNPALLQAIGGAANRTYETMAVSVLVHWGKHYSDAEAKAKTVYDCLADQPGQIGLHRVIKIDMRTDRPVCAGMDSKGIFEFVVNCIIYYEKEVI